MSEEKPYFTEEVFQHRLDAIRLGLQQAKDRYTATIVGILKRHAEFLGKLTQGQLRVAAIELVDKHLCTRSQFDRAVMYGRNHMPEHIYNAPHIISSDWWGKAPKRAKEKLSNPANHVPLRRGNCVEPFSVANLAKLSTRDGRKLVSPTRPELGVLDPYDNVEPVVKPKYFTLISIAPHEDGKVLLTSRMGDSSTLHKTAVDLKELEAAIAAVKKGESWVSDQLAVPC